MEEKIKCYLNENSFEYEQQVNMSERTWIRRGPVVPFLIFPHTQQHLKDIIGMLRENNARYKVIGHTSNLYFKPTFVADAIVCTRKMTTYHDDGSVITCDTGVSISRLSEYAIQKGYRGFEGLVGLPGTVGAAVVNNSSCFKCSISELVDNVVVFEKDEIRILSHDDLLFQRRSSSIKRGERNAIILGVKLKIRKTDDLEGLKREAQNNVIIRKTTQEGKAQNLGSVFSCYHPRVISISLLGWKKALEVIFFRVREHFLRNDKNYQLRRNQYLFNLFGYQDISKYVSDKNINCFVWKDTDADKAFERYLEFMHKYADCESLEIEILK